MSARFEELAWRQTPIGAVSLRRRLDPALHTQVYEVKLDDDFLMSSLFTVAEIELARLGLGMRPGDGLDVLVGGLGLGYTARTVLEEPRVGSLVVIEALDEVIGWHQQGLLPFAEALNSDPRSRLVLGDFFAGAADSAGFDPAEPGRRFDVILLDIDHSPRNLLHPDHAGFYTLAGLRQLAGHLRPGGVFGLWSDDPPDPRFTALLAAVFRTAQAEVVAFEHPLRHHTSTNTIYLARAV